MKLLSCCTTSFLLCGCYSGRKLTTAEHFSNSTFLKSVVEMLPGPRASQNQYFMHNLKMQTLACAVQSKSQFTE